MTDLAIGVRLPVLRGDDNYRQWAATFKRLLRAEGQWAIITGDDVEPDKYTTHSSSTMTNGNGPSEQTINPAWEAWQIRDGKANFNMFVHLSPGIQHLFAHHNGAKGLWDEVTRAYDGKSKNWA